MQCMIALSDYQIISGRRRPTPLEIIPALPASESLDMLLPTTAAASFADGDAERDAKLLRSLEAQLEALQSQAREHGLLGEEGGGDSETPSGDDDAADGGVRAPAAPRGLVSRRARSSQQAPLLAPELRVPLDAPAADCGLVAAAALGGALGAVSSAIAAAAGAPRGAVTACAAAAALAGGGAALSARPPRRAICCAAAAFLTAAAAGSLAAVATIGGHFSGGAQALWVA